MKEYTGLITVSFIDVEAKNREELYENIKKQLGKNLVLEEVEISSVYGDGMDEYDFADIFYDEMKMKDIEETE